MTTTVHGPDDTTWSLEDRRDWPRWELRGEANLILDSNYDISCPIHDVSGSGIAVSTDLTPGVGDEAVVYVRALGRFRAQVARVADGHVAFRFLIEDERQIILLQRLDQRLRRQDTARPADT